MSDDFTNGWKIGFTTALDIMEEDIKETLGRLEDIFMVKIKYVRKLTDAADSGETCLDDD